MILWRLANKDKVKSSLTGIGSKSTGGRWNHPGTPVVYCSESIALCLLELQTRVDLDLLPDNYMKIKLSLPDSSSIKEFPHKNQLSKYLNPFHTQLSRDYGTKWAEDKETLILKVPSAVVPEQFNYILNPMHPEMNKVKIAESTKLYIDPRIL